MPTRLPLVGLASFIKVKGEGEPRAHPFALRLVTADEKSFFVA